MLAGRETATDEKRMLPGLASNFSWTYNIVDCWLVFVDQAVVEPENLIMADFESQIFVRYFCSDILTA